jgi:hypothetical protein
MHIGNLVFSQLMEFAPWHTFRHLVAKYRGDFNVRTFSCLDQFLSMAFAQLTYRESLRDIEACLRAQPTKLYHMGLRGKVSRSALADANESRDWRIYAEFAHSLIRTARRLYAQEPLAVDLAETVYALDATTIDLCLSLFPWAKFRKTKAAVKLHTLLDLRGAIPSFIHISDGKLHDVNVLDVLIAEPGAFYVMDRGYLDFERLYRLHQAASFFVTRAKSNFKFKRLYSRPGRSQHGIALRPRSRTRCILLPPRLPGAAASHPLSRCRRSATGILDQSYDVGAFDHLRVIPLALASRIVLQVNQATPTHQTLLRHLRERREDPSLDRGHCVRVSCHRAQASQSGVVLARNVTDSEHHTIRENPYDSAPYLLCNQRRYLRRSQSTDFIMKRVGHY